MLTESRGGCPEVGRGPPCRVCVYPSTVTASVRPSLDECDRGHSGRVTGARALSRDQRRIPARVRQTAVCRTQTIPIFLSSLCRA
jgi:hypothetical protein